MHRLLGRGQWLGVKEREARGSLEKGGRRSPMVVLGLVMEVMRDWERAWVTKQGTSVLQNVRVKDLYL